MNLNGKSPPEIPNYFGENVRFERQRRKMEQKDLALIFEVQATTISHWETKRASPPIPTFLVVCEYFGRSPNEMLLTRLSTVSGDIDYHELAKRALANSDGEKASPQSETTNGGGGRASPPLSRETAQSDESDTELKQKLQELEQRLQKLEQLELLQAH